MKLLNFLFPPKDSEEQVYTKYLVDPKYKAGIGDYTYGKIRIFDWNEGSKLKIGKFCSLVDGTTILLGGEHRTDWITTYPFSGLHRFWKNAEAIKGHPRTKGDVIIGNDVWIGMNVTILSGVTIGDGAVIGAGSLVSRDVPAYTIASGVPAKVIRKRFKQSEIDRLLKIQWWNWSKQKIERNLKTLCSSKVTSLHSTI